jgi:hypothetical protein
VEEELGEVRGEKRTESGEGREKEIVEECKDAANYV